jgi:hypothetical protein
LLLQAFGFLQLGPFFLGDVVFNGRFHSQSQLRGWQGIQFCALMAMHADEGGVTAVGLLGSQGNEVEIVKVFLEDSQALPSEGLLAVAMQLGLYIPFEIEPGGIVVSQVIGMDWLVDAVPTVGNLVGKGHRTITSYRCVTGASTPAMASFSQMTWT